MSCKHTRVVVGQDETGGSPSLVAESFRDGPLPCLRRWFLDRDKIYCTAQLEERYGAAARDNLSRAIAALG